MWCGLGSEVVVVLAVEIEEGFIAQKKLDGAEILTAQTSFGMTGGRVWWRRAC
jgi:hypothetical protein